MKNNRQSISIAAASSCIMHCALCIALCLTSCANDLADENVGEDNRAKVIISASKGSAATRISPVGDDETTFVNGDKIKVAADGQSAIEYTLAAGGWTSNGALYWDDYKMDFTAYYPVNSTTSATTFTVPQTQSTADGIAADWMVFDGSVEQGDGYTAAFELERKMARVTVKVTQLSAVYGTSTTISSLTIKSNKTIPAGSDGTIEVTPLMQNGEGGVGTTYTALIAPSTSTSNIITVKLSDNSTTFTISLPNGATLNAGKSYTYDLKVKASKTEVDGTSNTITLRNAGSLTAEYITTALNNGTKLKIIGEMNSADFETLRTNASKLTTLDLSGVNLVDDNGKDTGELPQNALKEMSNLTEVTLPATCTSLGKSAFYNCYKLTTVNGTDNITQVSDNALQNCYALKSIKLDKATSIGGYAFYNCHNALGSISLPAATSIGFMAFASCSALKKVELPSATTFKGYVFQNCTRLTSIYLTAPSFESVNEHIFDNISNASSCTLYIRDTSAVSNGIWIPKKSNGSSAVQYNETINVSKFKEIKQYEDGN